MCRPGPTWRIWPKKGFGVKGTQPGKKQAPEYCPVWLKGCRKFTLLKRLKNSTRNWTLTRSFFPTEVFFKKEKSKFTRPGPLKVLRASAPGRKKAFRVGSKALAEPVPAQMKKTLQPEGRPPSMAPPALLLSVVTAPIWSGRGGTPKKSPKTV